MPFYSNNYSNNVFLSSIDAVPSTNQIETTDAIKHDKVDYKPVDDDQEEQQQPAGMDMDNNTVLKLIKNVKQEINKVFR